MKTRLEKILAVLLLLAVMAAVLVLGACSLHPGGEPTATRTTETPATEAPPPPATATITPSQPTSTGTPDATQTAEAARIRLLGEFSTEGGPGQCDVNTLDLQSPTFQQNVEQAYQSIIAQIPDLQMYYVNIFPYPGPPGSIVRFEGTFNLTLTGNQVDKKYIVACGRIIDGDRSARITYLVFPIPLPQGGTEIIPIGIVTEHDAEDLLEKDFFGEDRPINSDAFIFECAMVNWTYYRLDLYVDSPWRVPEEFRNNWITTYNFHIVPKIFDQYNIEVTQYLSEVLYYNNFSHYTELKALLRHSLLTGVIEPEGSRPCRRARP